MINLVDLWRSNPHERGPGKLHLFSSEEGRLLCGKFIEAVPGRRVQGEAPTCGGCANKRLGDARWAEEKKKREEEQRQREAERRRESEEWWAEYNAYLASPEWARRRRAVLERCHGVCEGCGVRAATQVHHLSYEHVRAEFLWELVGICDVCHARRHADAEQAAGASGGR